MSHKFVPKSSYSYEELLQCGEGNLFAPEDGRLPKPPMLMFDRISAITVDGGIYDKGYICAELDIHPDLWFFDCHFKDDPVMPGCLGLDAMWQLIGFFLIWAGNKGRGRALGSDRVRFTNQVLRTAKKVTYEINMKRVITRRLVMGVGNGKLLIDNKLAYEAEDLRVGLFTLEEMGMG